MATDDGPAETEVGDQGTVTVPTAIRRRLNIDEGDKLRWEVTEDGQVAVEVVHQREGVFDDFEPVDAGETNAVEAEGQFGSE